MAVETRRRVRAGAVSMSIDVGEIIEIAHEMSGPRLDERTRTALEATLAAAAKEAAKLARRDTGKLAGSITFKIWGKKADRMWGSVSSPLKYAHEIEYGLKPKTRMPKKGELVGWMKRKGFNVDREYALRMKLWNEGHPAYPFLRPAMKSARGMLADEMMRGLDTSKVRGKRGSMA